MIELAPQHKIGLSLSNPVMIAAGCAGYGQAYHSLLDLAAFGAIVTNPITLRPRRGPAQPRLAETPGGFILNTGEQNPGVKKIIQQAQKSWTNLSTAIIAHLPVDEPDDLLRTARALAHLETPQGQNVLAAIELGLPPQAHPHEARRWIRAIQEGSPLPLLVKLPLGTPFDLAEAVAEAQADALVIGSPPQGAAQAGHGGAIISGALYGPALHSLALYDLQQLKSWLDLPIVAAGGIHSLANAEAFLAAGATAIQLDSLLFIEPKQAESIAKHLNSTG
ncbi:MAG: nitronate monooxygenase [Anaerolineae bacterium]|nr:nitronate monooxygenase [Anaerolineae bacterium]